MTYKEQNEEILNISNEHNVSYSVDRLSNRMQKARDSLNAKLVKEHQRMSFKTNH